MSIYEDLSTTPATFTTSPIPVFPSEPEEKTNWLSENPTLTTVFAFLLIIFGGVVYVKFCGKKKDSNPFNNENLHSDENQERETSSTSVLTMPPQSHNPVVVQPSNIAQRNKVELGERNPTPPPIGWALPNENENSQIQSRQNQSFRANINLGFDSISHSLVESVATNQDVYSRGVSNGNFCEDPPPPYPDVLQL